MNGFAPHGQYDCTYSYWPIILTPYKLPPGMCVNSGYIFWIMVISGPSNPKCLIDVYLEPPIEEFQCGCTNARQCKERDIHDALHIDVDRERPTRLWDGVWMEYCWCYGVSSLFGRHTGIPFAKQ
ncbi:UNVERIFIED_CONTAM: hypothetical protein Slati_1417400 [Sesamum latifolium]|uniref:Uncharacterized protein n=1 Tax=Sesamum latifolium TaxID=2727402 RepID=A0AAW2X5A5_9LAMI